MKDENVSGVYANQKLVTFRLMAHLICPIPQQLEELHFIYFTVTCH